MDSKLQDRFLLAKSISERSGILLLDYFGKAQESHRKSKQDFTLDADLASEKTILEAIKKDFPDDSILSEEAGVEETGSEFRWVIDPLDGTANFKAGLPYFCVTLSLEHNANPVFAVVYNPLTKELFSAVKGEGAFLNDSPIYTSSNRDLSQFLVSYSTSNHKNEQAKELGSYAFSQALNNCRAVRLQGSSILDLCSLACGKFDALLKVQASYWDFAAGALIVEEAGGKVTDWNGAQRSKDSSDILVSNGTIHSKFVGLMKNVSQC